MSKRARYLKTFTLIELLVAQKVPGTDRLQPRVWFNQVRLINPGKGHIRRPTPPLPRSRPRSRSDQSPAWPCHFSG